MTEWQDIVYGRASMRVAAEHASAQEPPRCAAMLWAP